MLRNEQKHDEHSMETQKEKIGNKNESICV